MAKKQLPATDAQPNGADTASEGQSVGEALKRPPTEIATVTMLDGRIVEFASKTRMKKSTSIDADGNVSLRIDFRDGHSVSGVLPSQLILTAAAHGFSQKVGDAAAGEKDLDDAEIEVEGLMERIAKGEWAAPREAGASTGAGLLVRALVKIYGKTTDEMKAFVKALSKAEATELRNSSELAPTIAELKAAKANPNAPKASDILARLQPAA